MKRTPKISRTHKARKEQPPTSESETQHDQAPTAKNEEEQSEKSRSRRAFLGKVTAAAVAASVIGIPKLIQSRGAEVPPVGSSRVDLQACKLEYSIVSPK